jgi:hypothetical protein
MRLAFEQGHASTALSQRNRQHRRAKATADNRYINDEYFSIHTKYFAAPSRPRQFTFREKSNATRKPYLKYFATDLPASELAAMHASREAAAFADALVISGVDEDRRLRRRRLGREFTRRQIGGNLSYLKYFAFRPQKV